MKINHPLPLRRGWFIRGKMPLPQRKNRSFIAGETIAVCQRCNYTELLEGRGLEPIVNRVRVLEVIGDNPSPLSAQEVFATLGRTADINRVTVYRILDLLVEKGLVERLSSGGRSRLYGMAPNPNHPAHPHFHCRSCGALQCLQPGSLTVDLTGVERSFAGEVQAVEVRLEGVCKTCLKAARR
jgi:Fur family transcriptional regulator, ferric uptake regulator